MFQTGITRGTPYTLQEAFTRIWQFFVVEKHPQAADNATCCYRTADSACAIGCLLPEDFDFEHIGRVTELMARRPAAKHLLGGIDAFDLFALQNLHDRTPENCFQAIFEKRLREFAISRGLRSRNPNSYEQH